jgi:hypothetical protein
MPGKAKWCSICERDDVDQINQDLLRGLSVRHTASRAGDVTIYRSIHRHRRKCLVEMLREAGITRRDLLVEFMEDERERMQMLADSTMKSEKRVAVSASTAARGHVELIAKLDGDLATGPTFNVLVANPEWSELRAAILDTLRDFPEAKAAVMETIRAHHTGDVIDLEPEPVALPPGTPDCPPEAGPRTPATVEGDPEPASDRPGASEGR